MKKTLPVFLLFTLAACNGGRHMTSEHLYWYQKLYAVDSARITDSAIVEISEDSNMVKEILKSAEAARRIQKERDDYRRMYEYYDSIDRARTAGFGFGRSG
jgi:hypothetical protein